MKKLSINISNELSQKLEVYSAIMGISRSEIVRNALIDHLEKDSVRKGSFYDLARDIAGCVSERSDLSTNKKYFQNTASNTHFITY